MRYLARSLGAEAVSLAQDCPICIEGSGAVGVRLPCSHAYHLPCLARWLRTDRSCPMCRRPCADARRERALARLRDLRAYLSLPVETLLRLRGSVSAPILLGAAPGVVAPSDDEVRRTLLLAERLVGPAHPAEWVPLRERWRAVQECRREISAFDAAAAEVSAEGAPNPVCREVALRVSLPFDALHNRAQDRWAELNALRQEESAFGRRLRARLCSLWRIEAMARACDGASPSLPSSSLVVRSVLPGDADPSPPAWLRIRRAVREQPSPALPWFGGSDEVAAALHGIAPGGPAAEAGG